MSRRYYSESWSPVFELYPEYYPGTQLYPQENHHKHKEYWLNFTVLYSHYTHIVASLILTYGFFWLTIRIFGSHK